MFKVASDKRQKALRRGGQWDKAKGEEAPLDDERAYLAMKTTLARMEARIAALSPKNPERRVLGLQKIKMQAEQVILRARAIKARNAARSIADLFMDVCKEQLPPGQFKAFLAAARRRDQENAEHEPRNAEHVLEHCRETER